MAARPGLRTRKVIWVIGAAILVLSISYTAANGGSFFDSILKSKEADLRLESFVLDKSQATVGETIRATVEVSNWGNTRAKSTRLTFWAALGGAASMSNASRIHAMDLGTMPNKTRLTYVTTFPFPAQNGAGTYRIFAAVDTSTSESTKRNNTTSRTLQVSGASSSTDVVGSGATQPSSGALSSRAEVPAQALISAGHFYQQSSVWTTPIPRDVTIGPNSANYRDDFLRSADFFVVNRGTYAATVWQAQATDPLVTVTIRGPGAACAANNGWTTLRIPTAAVPPGGNDGHVIVYDANYVWEMYQAVKDNDTAWHAYSLKRFSRSGNGIDDVNHCGAIHNCGYSSMLLGIIKKPEVDAGSIPHAIRYSYNGERLVSGGAQREYPCHLVREGLVNRTWAHDSGFRFQLDPAFDINQNVCNGGQACNTTMKAILKAMQDYGIIFSDNVPAGENDIYAESDVGKPWSWSGVFQKLDEVVIQNLRLVK